MKNKLIVLLAIIITNTFLFSFKAEEPKVQWLTLEEAFSKTQKEPRKIVVDVYTDWCGWCKVMDKNTFANPLVANYLSKKFYAVKFNAESTKDIKLGTTVYKFDEKSKVHQAGIALLKGQMSYPTVVFLDEKFNMIQPVAGYREAKAFHQLATWFGGNFYTKEAFEAYSSGTYTKLFAEKK